MVAEADQVVDLLGREISFRTEPLVGALPPVFSNGIRLSFLARLPAGMYTATVENENGLNTHQVPFAVR